MSTAFNALSVGKPMYIKSSVIYTDEKSIEIDPKNMHSYAKISGGRKVVTLRPFPDNLGITISFITKDV